MQEIPKYAVKALTMLEENGYEAYLVGGCVRDFIMDIPPHDYDITTNALPEQTAEVFSKCKVRLTGAKHGTNTVLIGNESLEITTYRIDGTYSDNRHPDSVEFSSRITDDLKRRDFTMNAIAMDMHGNIIDPFGGKNDIKNKIIRAVGEPERRFEEDALRILRALRFASRLGFEIEDKTSQAIHNMCSTLENISFERINSEFTAIVCGKYGAEIMRNYRDVIAVFIPEIIPCFDFDQHSPYHKYDVWEHTLHAVSSAVNDNIKLAMFFHDIGKPQCFTIDESGRGHFKGHAEKSAEMTFEIMKRLRYSNRTIRTINILILHHSDKYETRYELCTAVRQLSADTILELLEVKKADCLAKEDFCCKFINQFNEQEKIVDQIINKEFCISLKQMKVKGIDLIRIGYKGKEIGYTLKLLLDKIIMNELPNNRKELMNYAKSLKK